MKVLLVASAFAAALFTTAKIQGVSALEHSGPALEPYFDETKIMNEVLNFFAFVKMTVSCPITYRKLPNLFHQQKGTTSNRHL